MLLQRAHYPFIVATLLLMVSCKQADNADTPSTAKTLESENLTPQAAPSLPDLQLATLDAGPVSLRSYAGRPVVLNLWATWCPPCRREMPVFEQAQREFPDVSFVMINQGESAQQAQAFLESEGLTLTDVLLDPSSDAMQTMRTGGLPTTFFFDSQGRLVDLHLGEIAMPGLKDKMSPYFD